MEENQHNSHEGGTITLKKSDLWKYSTFVLGALVIVLAFVAFSGEGTVTGNVVAGNNAPTPTPSAPSAVSADAGNGAFLGPKDAKVQVIEFSDFQCPFCARAGPIVKQIVAEYDDVSVVYRHFPLTSIHPEAQPAAEASECVRKFGGDDAFWRYHDVLFENQRALNDANYKAWALEMGFDISACLDSGEFRAQVQKDAQDAQAAGGRGTPYFVVVGADGEGTPVSGAQPFSAFKPIIDAKLAAA